jgi:hypothetical protein
MQIRGFDTFYIVVYTLDGQEVGQIQYNPSDFDGFIDLDSHTVDFLLSENGVPERTLQASFEE